MRTLKEKIYGSQQLYIPNIRDEALVDQLKAFDRYKLRIISVCEPEDMAIMPSSLRSHVIEMLYLFRQYGLPVILSDRVIYLDTNNKPISEVILQEIKQIRPQLSVPDAPRGLMPYMAGFRIDKISQMLGLPVAQNGDAAQTINNKHIVHMELYSLGVCTPPGTLVHSIKQAKQLITDLVNSGYDEFGFKIIYSSSGLGVCRVGINEVDKHLELCRDNLQSEGVFIDGWISGNITASPNIQYLVGSDFDKDLFVSCSNQIMAGTTHQGNINETEILTRVQNLHHDLPIIRNWIRSKGGYGINGLDFIIRSETEGEVAYLLENNGRTNGCTHGVVLADKLQRLYGSSSRPLEWGVNNNVSVPVGTTTHELQTWLDKTGISFNPEYSGLPGMNIPRGPRGVLIINPSPIESHGKAMVLVVSAIREDIHQMMAMLAETATIMINSSSST